MIDEGEREDLRRDAIRERMGEAECRGCHEPWYGLDADGYCPNCREVVVERDPPIVKRRVT